MSADLIRWTGGPGSGLSSSLSRTIAHTRPVGPPGDKGFGIGEERLYIMRVYVCVYGVKETKVSAL